MKIIYLCLLSCICSANLFGQWTQINSGTIQSLKAIYFLNNDTGFIGGSAGITSTTLLKTTDGGMSWISPNISTVNSIRSIKFINAQIGFLTTSAPAEGFKTIDGGNNWTYVNTAIYNDGDVYFKNIDTGFVYSPNNGNDVSYTFNGGTTWTHYPTGTFNGVGISSINFPNPNSSIGFAVSAWSGRIFTSTDGGVTWSQISQPTSQVLNDVFFTSTNEGYALGLNFILKTSDGGINWITANSSIGGYKFNIINTSVYVVVLSSTYLSTDGGINFSTMTGTINGLNNLHILSDSSGYCVGESGRIFKLGASSSVNESFATFNPINIFPNPVNEILFVVLSNQNGSTLEMFNLEGQLVKKTTLLAGKTEVNIKDLTKGLYIYRIISQEGVCVGKLNKK